MKHQSMYCIKKNTELEIKNPLINGPILKFKKSYILPSEFIYFFIGGYKKNVLSYLIY